MSNTSPTYTVVAANIDLDSDKILALWDHGLTHSGLPEAKFDWYYRKNPAGTPTVFFLCHGDEQEPVGVASVGTREIWVSGRPISSGELVDFVALPEHRTLFPALFLQKEIRRLTFEVDRSHDFLYGLPNPKSLAVVKRVGYRLAGQMVRRARMLRSAEYLSRYAPRWISYLIGPIVDRIRLGSLMLRASVDRQCQQWQSQWLDRPDRRFDDLWQRVVMHEKAGRVFMGSRDSAFLTWRFADCPLRAYRFFALASAADNRLIAYAACAVSGQTLHVHDFLIDPAERSAGKALWLMLSREAFYRGHSNISVEFLGAEAIQHELQAAGLMKRQQRPLYVAAAGIIAVASNAIPVAPFVLDWGSLYIESSWYLTCADEDG